ncbi:MAG: peptidoglycan editing factor PgeF [Ardenticatenaceae bacterium]|nr:peptidoglycan editing factor PgeF [Ardenticatenaceae bacterium]
MQQHLAANGVLYLTFDLFPADRLSHGVLSRQGGTSVHYRHGLNLSSSVPDEPHQVEENHRRGYGAFDRKVNDLVHAHLIHEAHVAVVSSQDHGEVIPACDGLVTADPGCGLTMNYADCAPIVLYDPRHHAASLGHAGWRGTIADVPGAMVRAMQKAFGSAPADLLAGIGPSISATRYEVGREVVEAVQQRYGAESDVLLPQIAGKNKRHFDLPQANRLNLLQAGVTQIEMSEICTAERTDLFFSHRAENGKTGRFGVVVVLRPETGD